MDTNDFSRLGFDSYKAKDLSIIMSLTTKDEIKNWMLSVGSDDVEYGMQLLETAMQMQLLEEIDFAVDNMNSFVQAKKVLSKF